MIDHLPRRSVLHAGAGALALALLPGVGRAQSASADQKLPRGGRWPAWDAFKSHFVSPEGRVISDDGEGGRTYSEGQSYGLFFALVANDRKGFETLLKWTIDNLCAGDMTARLPAWLWGKRDDGTWGVIDANAASDADIWIAYVLGEAGRLWKEPRYHALGASLAARVLNEVTATLPGLGLSLLPAPKGFDLPEGRYKLNPSYMPLQVMQRLTTLYPAPGWNALLKSSQRIIIESSPKGFTPDWTIYDPQKGFLIDEKGAEKGMGGYNAIRVYLWAGTMHAAAPGRKALLDALAPMATYVREKGHPPEAIDVLTGQAANPGPPGFTSAILPFLQAQRDSATLQIQRNRLIARPIRPTAYYEQTLDLFSTGWMSGWYRYTAGGQLQRGSGKAD